MTEDEIPELNEIQDIQDQLEATTDEEDLTDEQRTAMERAQSDGYMYVLDVVDSALELLSARLILRTLLKGEQLDAYESIHGSLSNGIWMMWLAVRKYDPDLAEKALRELSTLPEIGLSE